MDPSNLSLESDIRSLTRELSQLRTDSRESWATTQRLRITLEGENGHGGIQEAVTKIAAKQEADSQVIRLAVWFPSVISMISLIISLIALLR
jgi:hypothetical protein